MAAGERQKRRHAAVPERPDDAPLLLLPDVVPVTLDELFTESEINECDFERIIACNTDVAGLDVAMQHPGFVQRFQCSECVE